MLRHCRLGAMSLPMILGLLLLLPSSGFAGESLEIAADIDCDGQVEVLIAAWDLSHLTLRDAAGGVVAVIALDAPLFDAPRFEDRDLDGLPDLVSASQWLMGGNELAEALGAAKRAASPAIERPFSQVPRFGDYTEAWNTSAALTNVWDAAADLLDGDPLWDLVTQVYYYPGTQVIVFENDGDDSFAQSCASPVQSTPSIVALATGETDGDGQKEILAGEAGTLGRLYMWEFVGDDSIEERTLGLRLDWQVRGIATGDTDGDGRREILGAGSASTDGGSVKIFEHAGLPGENSYDTVYDYDTPSYLLGLAPGDADNDGRGEVVLQVGGMAGFPTYIRRIEYNPGAGTWEHKLFEGATTGLPISALVADLDGDGENELVLGSSEVIHIYESFADDSFTPVWSSGFPIAGNVMDLTLGLPNDLGYPVVVACSFEGQVYMVGFDGVSYRPEMETPLYVGNPLRSVDHGYFDGDLRDDLVLARSGVNLVSVYEGADLTAASAPPATGDGLILAANPNPFRDRVGIRYELGGSAQAEARLEVLDIRGRRVAKLLAAPDSNGAGHLSWDGCDERGRPMPSGVYLLRLRDGTAARGQRIVLMR